MSTWKNSDGLFVRFGRDVGKREAASGSGAGVQRGSVVRTAGNEIELTFQVDLEGAARTTYTADRNNDGTLDGFILGLDTPLPAGCKIVDVETVALETPAGGTTWALGTFQVDGTAIDADGLTAAAAVSQGADGAQVGTVLSQAGYVAVTTVGTYTAGKLHVVIRAIVPAADLA
jgi:hypothetical protein